MSDVINWLDESREDAAVAVEADERFRTAAPRSPGEPALWHRDEIARHVGSYSQTLAMHVLVQLGDSGHGGDREVFRSAEVAQALGAVIVDEMTEARAEEVQA
mgnify:CR=1 FL=1